MRSAVTPHTVESLRAELHNTSLAGPLAALERGGALRIIHDPKNPSAGWWNGKVATLNAAHIPRGEALGVALHELGVHRESDQRAGLRHLVGEAEFNSISKRLDELAKGNDSAADLVRAADARIDNADTPPHQRAEERLAYVVEEGANRMRAGTLTGQARALMERIWARLRVSFMRTRLYAAAEARGVAFKLTPDDMVALAKAAVRRQARDIKSDTGRNDILHSKPRQTDTPEFKAWFGKSQAIDDAGKPLVLYHGTTGKFDEFAHGKGSLLPSMEDVGHHFGDAEQALQAASDQRFFIDNSRDSPKGEKWPDGYITEKLPGKLHGDLMAKRGANLIPVYLKIEHPLTIVDTDNTMTPQLLARELVAHDIFTAASAEHVTTIGQVREALKAKGYDGLKYTNEYEGRGRTSWVALDSEQIKSAIANRGTFDAKDPNILHSKPRKSEDPFYSAIDHAMREAKGAPKSADATAWKQWFDGGARRGDFKTAEREWMGVDQFLDTHKGPLTREQVQEFVRQNQVKLTESTLSANHFDSLTEPGPLDSSGPSKFGQYTLPGGKNYREMLLTLPERKDGLNQRDKLVQERISATRAQLEEARAGGVESEIQHAQTMLDNLIARNPESANKRAENYQSGHFDEPNILAHVRVNDRVGPNGEKILHVEEIQSDWHQSGRKQGYGSAPITEVVRGGRTMFEVEENVYSSRDAAEAQAKKKGVPDAPFKKEWPMLAFKRALRMAVDKGYDKVTWTTGAQQADRFDLSKQVNSIDVVKQRTLGGVDRVAFLNMPGGRGDVDLHINSEGKITKGEYAGKGVDEVVGKEMAEKIMGVEDQKKFSGSDLRVGGEGMKAFYDKMLPNEVNKYVKQWGAKVGEASIDVNRGIAYDYSARKYMLRDAPGMEGKQFSTEAEARAAGSQGVHSLDITPAMVESVRAGQPLFSKPRKAAGVDDMFGAKDKEREKSVMRVPENSDLFGGPSTRDHLDAASRGKAAQRNGLNGGRADTGDGGLFDGERPEQTSIDQRGKTMFSKPRDDLSEQRTEDAPELPPLNNIGQAHSAAAAIMAVGDPKHMQELTRGDIRSALARRDRRVAQADASVNAFIKYFDKRPKEVREDPRQALADVIRFQRGEPTLDPLTRPFFASVRHLLDTQAAEIRSHGSKYLEHLVENYFPQQWEEPERTHAFYTDAMAKRPLAGGKKFTKERVFNDYEEGIAAGFKPISTNPADLLMGRYQAGEKLLASLRIMKALEDRGVVHDLEKGERIPVGFARVNDTSFTSKVIPELSAHDLNNYLDPGLTKFAAWRGFRYMQNLLLSARLGLSAFHAGMTTLDTIATHADIGWRRIALLHDVKGGLRELAKIPVAVYTSPKGGNKLMRQFEGKEAADPNTAAILDALAEGGARGKMNPVDYNDDYRKLMRAIDQGDARTIAMKAIPGAIEGTTRLIAHHLVPAQKMTARVMHMKFRLDQVSDDLGTGRGNYKDTLDALHPDTLKQISYEINATIDDRLGQFAYDNLFWNKTMKDALHASVQSVGWNWGSLRLIVGGIGDARRLAKPEGYIAPLDKAGTITNVKQSRLTDRLSYLITLNAVVGMMGATTQYLMTGQGPKDAKDFFFPRTGRKNADDTEERIAFPSYVKDEFSWLFHPLTTASHKLHPSLSMLTEIARNKDFYGTEVYDPDASIPTEAKQFLTYLGKSMMPYAIQGAAKNASTGTSAVMTALPFIGITPASGEVTKSKFQEYVADKYYDTLPSGARSQEKTDISANFKAAVKAARDGEQPDTRGFTGSQLKRLATEKQELVPQIRFKRLPINQQLNAWEKATPDERESYKLRAAIMHGGYAKIGREPEVDQARLREQMKSVMASGAAAGD